MEFEIIISKTMKLLTIFTPTYNRAYVLPKLYESLCKEPSDKFVWLIVDDGSTDNTQSLVESWESESKIEIVYFKQANGGKMRAHNKGVELCTTPLFFCIDSDDQIADGAVSKIIESYIILKNDESLSGIVAKKQIVNRAVSPNLPDLRRSTLHNIYQTGFRGDTSLIFKISVLREFMFPEIDGEKFVTEAYVYDQIDQNYELLIMDEFLMKCKYLDDGYTANSASLFIKHPKGWVLYYAQCYRLYAKSLRQRVRYSALYISMCWLAHRPIKKILKEAPSMFFCVISIPVGMMFYKRILDSAK